MLFHAAAVDAQLQQAFYGFAAALALNRTAVLPKVSRSGWEAVAARAGGA